MKKNIVSNLLLVGVSAALLWFLSNIARFGSHYIQEPDSLILLFEIIFFMSVMAWGLYALFGTKYGK